MRIKPNTYTMAVLVTVDVVRYRSEGTAMTGDQYSIAKHVNV